MSDIAGLIGQLEDAARCRAAEMANDKEYMAATRYTDMLEWKAAQALATLDARVKELEAFGGKVNDIRSSIIGYQGINWSVHIYPLVAALNEAGFEGEEYEKARARAKTQVERIAELEAHNAMLVEVLGLNVAMYDYENKVTAPNIHRVLAETRDTLNATPEKIKAAAELSARNKELVARCTMLVGALKKTRFNIGVDPVLLLAAIQTKPKAVVQGIRECVDEIDTALNAAPEKIKAAAKILELAAQWRDGEVGSGAMSKAIGRFLGEDE